MEKIGRFAYIEPNDILDTANNTTHPYENYSIDVELEVSLPRRGVWVNSINKKGSVAVDRSGKNDNNGNIISFFGGEDGYLTSNPGSLIYKDILNSKQDRESLGITNIHISYNSYFYPQVTIKFTDIRGMGLMMPHEEVYRQEQTNTKDNNGKMTEKFFAALFSFPYPEFKLRVKGFYGKKVEYSLVVEDFKSNFNNQTGNFEATVKFIGKMYGIYTDIPMTHLLIAPYCKYGGNGETTIWDELSLTFPDNPSVRIPTLIKLKEAILTATNELKTNMSSNMNSELIKLSEKENCLSDLKIAYKTLFKYQFKESNNEIIRENNVILLPDGDVSSDNNYSYLSGESNFIKALVELCNKINDYNSKFDNQISTIKPYNSSENCYIPSNASYILNFKKNGEKFEVEKNNVLSNFCENFNNDRYSSLSTKLSYKLNSNSINNRSYFVIDCNDLYQNIEKLEENIKNKKVEQNKELNKQITEDLTSLLGYSLSIKNIFTIVMAHLNAYTELFKRCINAINMNNSRTLDNCGLSSSNLPDISVGISGNSVCRFLWIWLYQRKSWFCLCQTHHHSRSRFF